MNFELARRMMADVNAVIMSYVDVDFDSMPMRDFYDLSQSLGFRLKLMRAERGDSQDEVARATGLSRNTISAIESGGGNPTLETLWVLARYYDITIGELLGG